MTRVRIPTVALATLVFGGACGDDKSDDAQAGGTGGIDVSDECIAKLSTQLCKQALACPVEDDEEGDGEPLTQAECERAYADYFEEYSKLSEDCFDAILDYYECYAQLECSELDPLDDDDNGPCNAEHVDEVCGDQLDDEGDDTADDASD